MTEINFEGYKAKKAKGLWLAVKNDKGVGIQRKQFDVDTGLETTPVIEYFDIAQAQEIVDRLTKKLADIKTLVADANLL